MFVRLASTLFVAGITALVFVSCTQPPEVVEVPATVEVPVEVTREVPVTVLVDREVLATVEVPVTVEVTREVEVPATVEVPVTVTPDPARKDVLITIFEGMNEVSRDICQSVIEESKVRNRYISLSLAALSNVEDFDEIQPVYLFRLLRVLFFAEIATDDVSAELTDWDNVIFDAEDNLIEYCTDVIAYAEASDLSG